MTKKGLIYETLGQINNLQVLESQNPNEVRLSGVFGVCGIKNGNNRIYEKSNYGKMVELLKEQITTKGVLGELEHPNTMNITLENVSHMIEDITMNEDGTVTGTIKLLDTPKGKIAKAIIAGGAPLYISSRGAGSIDECGRVTLTTLATYDLVGTPGFSQAKLTLSKNQKFESLNESLESPCWMIVESEEEEPKKEGEETKTEPTKDGDSNKEGEESKTDGNKKETNNTKVTMEDLNKTIEELRTEVEQLRAELHVAKENYQPINYDAIQTWVEEEFAPDFRDSINEAVKADVEENLLSLVNETYSPILQQWITEEFAPIVENWTVNEFGNKMKQYVNEEYSELLQNWIAEEFAGEVHNWVAEEFSPALQGWITEEFGKEHAEAIKTEINENVQAFLEAKAADDKYSNIDKVLESLSKTVAEKKDAMEVLKEQQDEKYKGVFVVENMPNNLRPLWEALTDDKKEEILRSSRMYDFTKTGVLEKFWAQQNLTTQTIVESRQTPVQTANTNDKYASIFKAAAALRK